MARTKASVGARISSKGKSSKARCSAPPPASVATSSGSSERAARGSSGGNPVCPRETPKWQKPITNFFMGRPAPERGNSSTDEEHMDVETHVGTLEPPQKKRKVIYSDNEDEGVDVNGEEELKSADQDTPEAATNTVLDETIALEPLQGQECHKIEEYYMKSNKGKGKGKKSKGKENINGNIAESALENKPADAEIECCSKD